MRAFIVACVASVLSLPLHAAENKALLAAKTQYVRQTEPAHDSYIEVLDAEIGELVAAGELQKLVALRSHRGEFLLGLSPAGNITGGEAQVSPALQEAADKYDNVLQSSRAALTQAYEPAIKAALTSNDLDAATRMRSELESLASGGYAPSAMEVDRQKPFDVKRTVLEPLLIFPVGDMSIPDELEVSFIGPRFQVSGTCRTDVYLVNGERCGHFGKVVLLPPPRKRSTERTGYLLIGTRERESQYSFVVASGNHIAHIMQLGELELNAVHEWSVAVDRQELVFEVRRNGEAVMTARIPGNNRTIYGFCATLRYLDTKSKLVVALD